MLYILFKTIIEILYETIVSNSLCILFFALIYIVIDLYNPINYDINYEDKMRLINSQLLFSLKNQFLYDVDVPYHIQDIYDIEGIVILFQQIAVVFILVFYKLKFVFELHRKYHVKWI